MNENANDQALRVAPMARSFSVSATARKGAYITRHHRLHWVKHEENGSRGMQGRNGRYEEPDGTWEWGICG